MNKNFIYIFLLFFLLFKNSYGQLPPVFAGTHLNNVQTTETVRRYLSPVKILWKTSNASTNIDNAEQLLKPGDGQADLSGKDVCIIHNDDKGNAGILFDFGCELHGGLQLITDQSGGGKPVRVRIRFGESVSEAMSNIDTIKGATNDHAMRDFIISVPWLGKLEVGNTGFRFVRIDLVDDNVELKLKEVRAIFVYRDIPYLGSFKCSDTLLNKIWMTGAYTVHLNMQDYLWDGIKRDRLVWVGDMHPETSTIAAVFGDNQVVEKSLDQAREITPLPNYMAGMVSYSMWWLIIQRDLYMHTGNLPYLQKQSAYIKDLLGILCTKINSDNSEILDGGNRFLDWPSSGDNNATHAGLQGMMKITMEAGAELSHFLHDETTAQKCRAVAGRLAKNIPEPGNSKQAAAMLSLANLIPSATADKIITAGGVKNYSTFFGYYMLQAQAKAGDYQGGMNAVKDYWGPMLSLGATTFWEDFNLDWLKNAGRIDELVPEGKIDIHSAYGAYCYKGFRLSLCHGWASGPTPWLTQYILGVNVMAPGCSILKIEPHLGNLSYVEGTFPTPLGIVIIKNTKLANGKVHIDVKAPKGIRIIKSEV